MICAELGVLRPSASAMAAPAVIPVRVSDATVNLSRKNGHHQSSNCDATLARANSAAVSADSDITCGRWRAEVLLACEATAGRSGVTGRGHAYAVSHPTD